MWGQMQTSFFVLILLLARKGVAIPKSLFQKIVTCYFLIRLSQVTLLSFLRQKKKRNSSAREAVFS